jgi:ubiquinone/menaquinone biosynthesis C-methylase UbiE
MFLRKAKRREPVPVTMSGVRMGERLLQVGVDDPAVAGAIAAKVGLSGSATAVVADESGAARARDSATEAGVLVDVHVTPYGQLPFADGSFDVVVVHSAGGMLMRLERSAGQAAATEWYRVLRNGGRVVTIEAGARTGVAALLRGAPAVDPAYASTGGASRILESGGFRPVRVVGELEGFKFTEGLKS